MSKTYSRRALLGLMGAAGASVALASCGASGATPSVQSGGGTGATPSATSGGASGATPSAKSGGVLRMAALRSDEPLDPVTTRSTQETSFILFDRLTSVTPDLKVQPELALSWSSNPDLTQWTFKLRPGVKFHDGRPFTAKDVVYSFGRLLNVGSGSEAYATWGPLLDPSGIVASDDLTVVFNAKAPFWDLPAQAASNNVSIVPDGSSTDEINTKAIGTGPFVLKEHSPGNRLFATRNPNYWMAGRPMVDELRLFYVETASQRVAGLRSGEFDLVTSLDPISARPLKGASGFNVMSAKSGNIIQLAMLGDKPPFDNVQVRKALKLLIDRQQVIDQIFLGDATWGYDEPISPINPVWGNLQKPVRDVAQAKQLLAAAGYPNGLDLSLATTTGYPGMPDIAVLFQEQAKEGNVRIAVNQVPPGNMPAQLAQKAFPFATTYWSMRMDDQLLELLYLPRAAGGQPYQNWLPDNFQQALQAARSSSDEPTRLAKFAEVERIVAEEGPSIIPAYVNVIQAASTKVSGYQPTPIAIWPDFREAAVS